MHGREVIVPRPSRTVAKSAWRSCIAWYYATTFHDDRTYIDSQIEVGQFALNVKKVYFSDDLPTILRRRRAQVNTSGVGLVCTRISSGPTLLFTAGRGGRG